MDSEESRRFAIGQGLDRASRIARRGSNNYENNFEYPQRSSHGRASATSRLPKLGMLLAREQAKQNSLKSHEEGSVSQGTATTSSSNLSLDSDAGGYDNEVSPSVEQQQRQHRQCREPEGIVNRTDADDAVYDDDGSDENMSRFSVQSAPIDVDSLQEFVADDPSYDSYFTAPVERRRKDSSRGTRRRRPPPVDLDTGMEVIDEGGSEGGWDRQLVGYMPGFEVPRVKHVSEAPEIDGVIYHDGDKYEV